VKLFALLMDATAADGNEHLPGSRQHLLVLVRATSEEAAMIEALVALTEAAWRDAELKNIQPFGVSPSSLGDPVLRDAAMRAQEGHRSIVVFDQA